MAFSYKSIPQCTEFTVIVEEAPKILSFLALYIVAWYNSSSKMIFLLRCLFKAKLRESMLSRLTVCVIACSVKKASHLKHVSGSSEEGRSLKETKSKSPGPVL